MQNARVRTLLVLLHAQTEATRPGSTDHARRLTAAGLAEAAAVGDHLRSTGTGVGLALCSSATRAQQTLAALGVDCPTEITGELYNAGGDRILAALREVPDDVRGVIVVAHAPGLPGLVYELADPETSDPQALAVLETQFPPATLATLQLTDDWAHLRQATLTELRLP